MELALFVYLADVFESLDLIAVIFLIMGGSAFLAHVGFVCLEWDCSYTTAKERKSYKKTIKDGITIVVPEAPVNLFQYKKQLMAEGFTNFMIDLSHETISKNILKRLMTKYRFSEQFQPSTTFNFKKGLI